MNPRLNSSNPIYQYRNVPKTSSYQMFVKAMTSDMKARNPDSKQADNMRKIGELWRSMPQEERDRYTPAANSSFDLGPSGGYGYTQNALWSSSTPGFGVDQNSQRKRKRRDRGSVQYLEGVPRMLSPYNLFVKAVLQQLRLQHPELDQGELIKKVGELWRSMSAEDKAKWRADGEEGSRIPGAISFVSHRNIVKPSSYQMFVKAMTAEFKNREPDSKQADNMRKIGELWRQMPQEERERFAPTPQQVHDMQIKAGSRVASGAVNPVFSNGGLVPMSGRQGRFFRPGGIQRTLSAYNLFVRSMHAQLKAEHPELDQGEYMKRVGEMWRSMPAEERAKWRADGEEGSRVPGASTFIAHKASSKQSPYQMFVKAMTSQMKATNPNSSQIENMKQIGEMWRNMSAEERLKYAVIPEPNHNALDSYGLGADGMAMDKRRKALMDFQAMPRSMSAYNLFIRSMLMQLKAQYPEVDQGQHMKKAGEIWRNMSAEERAKWRADGEEGSRVPGATSFAPPKAMIKPSSYQMFVRAMTADLKTRNPDAKQADNMRKIGEMWRQMTQEDRDRYNPTDAQVLEMQSRSVRDLNQAPGYAFGRHVPLLVSCPVSQSDDTPGTHHGNSPNVVGVQSVCPLNACKAEDELDRG
eukprot:763783-Hanusia_phi.AAC.4